MSKFLFSREINLSCASIAVVAGLVAASPAAAQGAGPAAATAEDDGPAPIIVTANKRGNETVQNTPSSIGVITAEQLASKNIVNFDDITRNVAGLNVINEGPGLNTIMIRGLVGAGESTVGLYYDNLPTSGSGESAALTSGRQTDLVVWDAARVEVLRGPQSTLYGSSALAGVVRIISNEADPSGFAGQADFSAATIKEGSPSWSVKGMVNLPLSEKAAIRVVGYQVHTGGFVDDVQHGDKNFNKADQTGLRVNTKFELGEATTLTSQLYVQRLESAGAGFSRPWASPIGLVTFPAVGELQTDAATKGVFNDTTVLAGATLEHDFGPAVLTLSQSYQHRKNLAVKDNSGMGHFFRFLQSINAFPNVPTPNDLAFIQNQSLELWNTEARVATKFDGPFNLVAGVMYQTRDTEIENILQDVDRVSGLTIPASAANPIWFQRSATFKLKQFAAFGEANFKFSDKFSVLAGIRYFNAKRDDVLTPIVPFLRLGVAGTPDQLSSNENKAIFKFEADFKPTEHLMLYASASQGYRVGGTVLKVVPELPDAYGPDYTWNFEAGAKTEWFNRRLTANIALYHINWYDTQISGEFYNGAFEGILNCEGLCARSQGIEIDINARPVRGLDLGFSGTVFKAKWLKAQPAMNGSPAAGTQFADTPRHTFSAYANYEWDISDDFQMALTANVQNSGRIAFSDYRPQYNLHTPGAYTMVDVAATLSKGDRWSTKLFVDNLFDKRALYNVTADSVTPFSALYATPRTIGLELSVKY